VAKSEGSNRNLIIGIIIAVVVLCCCCPILITAILALLGKINTDFSYIPWSALPAVF